MTDSIERYEALAEEFYAETRVMAPGKDSPAAMGTYDAEELRFKLWQLWLKHRTPPATPDAGALEAEIARVISSEIGDAIAAHEAGEGEAAVSKRGETVARWIMDRIHPTPPRAASPDPVAVWVVREPSGNVIGAGASYHAALHDAQLNGGLPLALVFRLMEGIEKGDTLVMSGGYALMRESLATASRADATAGGVTEVLIAALRDIATNYDHDEQTREHTPGYGGACRVCTAEAALRAAQPDGGAK